MIKIYTYPSIVTCIMAKFMIDYEIHGLVSNFTSHKLLYKAMDILTSIFLGFSLKYRKYRYTARYTRYTRLTQVRTTRTIPTTYFPYIFSVFALSNACWELDLYNMGAGWTRMADMNVKRLYPGLASYASKLYVFGSACGYCY